MAKTFDALGRELKRMCGDGPVYYVPNPGNWGDALIRYGTLKFFRDIGLKVAEKNLRKRKWILPSLRGGTVLYGGGGGWNEFWDLSGRVKPFTRKFQVVVLPSTYAWEVDFERTVFFVRDNCESQRFMPEANFCHDMAFYIGDEFRAEGEGCGEAWFFRTDREAVGWQSVPASNRDLSLEGYHMSDVRPFFEIIGQYEVIRTDRLHVAIAGCLLGREVHLYENGYFKNRSVYAASMKGFFDRVYFHDFDATSPHVTQDQSR